MARAMPDMVTFLDTQYHGQTDTCLTASFTG